MQSDRDPSSNALDYQPPADRERTAVSVICLPVGICGVIYLAIFFWIPYKFAAVERVGLFAVLALPVVALISLIAGAAALGTLRRRSAHLGLAIAASTINLLVAGYGLYRLISILQEFSRSWGPHGMGP
jgi:hypothetical protein